MLGIFSGAPGVAHHHWGKHASFVSVHVSALLASSSKPLQSLYWQYVAAGTFKCEEYSMAWPRAPGSQIGAWCRHACHVWLATRARSNCWHYSWLSLSSRAFNVCCLYYISLALIGRAILAFRGSLQCTMGSTACVECCHLTEGST